MATLIYDTATRDIFDLLIDSAYYFDFCFETAITMVPVEEFLIFCIYVLPVHVFC